MPLNRIVWILLPLIAGLVHCQPKPHPEKMWRMYLQEIGVRFDAQFARDFYPGLREGILATRGRGQHPADQYTASCVAANSDTTISVMDLPPDQLPPGQSLDVATGDPGIKDRSISRMMLNWVPYMNDDFRHVCADDRLCDPTTYYREFRAVRAAGQDPTKIPPRPFLFFPTHPVYPVNAKPGCGPRNQAELIQLIHDLHQKYRAPEGVGLCSADPDRLEAYLDAVHELARYLKGEAVDAIDGRCVEPLINTTFSGMGLTYTPAMAFEHTPGDLAPPCLGAALQDFMRRLASQATRVPDVYRARFAPGDRNYRAHDYRRFLLSSPTVMFTETLRYTDDPHLQAGTRGDDPGDQAVRGIAYTSLVSTDTDKLGRPMLNGELQMPPSGLCVESHAFFIHASMLHTLDGWGVAAFASEQRRVPPMIALLNNYKGICEDWNTTHGDLTPNAKVLCRPQSYPIAVPHLELYDAHFFIPHGRLDYVRDRYNALKSPPTSPAGWRALGYKVPENYTPEAPCGARPCTHADLGLLSLEDCAASAAPESCANAIALSFDAAYAGITTRIASSLAPQHGGAFNASGEPTCNTAAGAGPICERFADPTAESVVDTIACRANANQPVVTNTACRYEGQDTSYPPRSRYRDGATSTTYKSTVVEETAMMLWNHTWTTGSIYPLHAPGGTQLPRYPSKGTESGGASAGLMDFHAFTHLEILAADCSRGANSDDPYGVCWLENDDSAGGYGYFSGPAIYEDDGSLDWHKLARAGRGDSVYLLRYYPERFLLPDGSVNVGTNLPFPSVKEETPIEDPAR